MFSIGFVELMMVGVVALLVLGPDRLPGAVRETTIWISRIRRHMSDLRRDFDEQLDDLQNDKAIAELMEGRRLLEKAERDLKTDIASPTAKKAPGSPTDSSA